MMYTVLLEWEKREICGMPYGDFSNKSSIHVKESENVSRSVVSDSLQPQWTITQEAPLSMGFPRQ